MTESAEPQAKRQRKRRSGWDAPAPAAVAVAPGYTAASAAAAAAVPMGFFLQASNPAMVSLVQQQLAMAMAMPGGAPAVGTYQPAVAGGYNIAGTFAQQAAIQAALAAAGAPGMAEVQEKRRRSRIYVGNLHYQLQEADVRAVFNPFGNIRSINLTVDPATGHHRGFCFVEYDTPENAASALAHMDKFELAGRQISVGRPHDGGAAPAPAAPVQSTAEMLVAAMNPAGAAGGAAQAAQQQQRFVPVGQCKIYVGNVPSQVNAEMLRTVFQPFGQVIGAEMVPDPANPGQHRGFGFLQFIEEKQARLAMDTMNNFELAGRNLRVSWAQDQVKPLPLLPGVVLPTVAASAPVSTADAVAAALRGAHVAMPTITSQPAPAAAAATSPTVTAAAASSPPPPAATVSAVSALDVTAVAAAAPGAAPALESSACVVMDDMVTQEDLSDPGLADEIAEECAKFGMVSRVETVPRRNLPGAARVFVVFADNKSALAAVHGLHERYFGGRVVQARLYDAAAFDRNELEL